MELELSPLVRHPNSSKSFRTYNGTNIQIILLVSKTKMEEGTSMTVIAQVKQTLAGLKSAQASLETFSLGTDNQEAKQLYTDAATQTQAVIDSLEPRLQQIQDEEPQYKQ